MLLNHLVVSGEDIGKHFYQNIFIYVVHLELKEAVYSSKSA